MVVHRLVVASQRASARATTRECVAIRDAIRDAMTLEPCMQYFRFNM